MIPIPLFRWLVIGNGAIPCVILAWDAYHGQLGANAVNNALHITGILSLVCLVLSLVMTPAHWLTKWAGWIASRRALGLYGFFYAVVHLLIYVVFDRAGNLGSTWQEVTTRRFLQLGMLAVILMVPLAVTSTNAMIQRIGPRRWKLLHRLSYVVVALGVAHYYLLVKSDVRQPIAFGVVVAGLLGSRFGRHYRELRQRAAAGPATPKAITPPKPKTPWRGELELVARYQETPAVTTFRLMAPGGGSLPFEYQPGQYLSLQLMIDGQRVNRSYTIASSPTRRDACELTIKREPAGLVSRYLHDQLRIGDRLKVTAPAGRFVFTGQSATSVLLIAGGVGITPVMSMLRYLTDRTWTGEIYFLVIAKESREIIFRDELMWLAARHPRLHLEIMLTQADADPTWTGARGRPTVESLRAFVPRLAETPIYLCGPNPMMDGLRGLLESAGVAPERIQTEAFASPRAAGAEPVTMSAMVDPSPMSAPVDVVADGVSTAVTFAVSQVETEVSRETTILEAAEGCGVTLPYECRSGICGQCKVRVRSGHVVMDTEDALSVGEKARGLILACQARPRTAVVVEG